MGIIYLKQLLSMVFVTFVYVKISHCKQIYYKYATKITKHVHKLLQVIYVVCWQILLFWCEFSVMCSCCILCGFRLTFFHFDGVRGSRCNSSCQVWNTERGNSTLSCPYLTPLCMSVYVYAPVKLEAYLGHKLKTNGNTLCKKVFHLIF